MGLIGLMVRWYESYLIGTDVGHIPISNLYEVFVLFCIITSLLYLYYEGRYATRKLGAFVLLIILAAVWFILWNTFDRGAHEIQPLVPALQSWWMKIHVPANFIGYGAFSIAAMVGGSLGWLLVLGSQGNLGADRVAELCRLAAHAADQGVARSAARVVGNSRSAGDHLRLHWRQHVPVGITFLRHVVANSRRDGRRLRQRQATFRGDAPQTIRIIGNNAGDAKIDHLIDVARFINSPHHHF